MEIITTISPFVYLHLAGQVFSEYSKVSNNNRTLHMGIINENIGILGNVMMKTAVRNTAQSILIIGGAFCLVVTGLGSVYLCLEIVPLIYRNVKKIDVYGLFTKFKRRIL